jgi:hypothetical protein
MIGGPADVHALGHKMLESFPLTAACLSACLTACLPPFPQGREMSIAEVSGGSDRRRERSLRMRWANVCFVTGESLRREPQEAILGRW